MNRNCCYPDLSRLGVQMLPLEWECQRRRVSGLGRADEARNDLQQCENGVWYQKGNLGCIVLFTLSPAEIQRIQPRLGRAGAGGIGAPAPSLRPPRASSSMDGLLLSALRGVGSSRDSKALAVVGLGGRGWVEQGEHPVSTSATSMAQHMEPRFQESWRCPWPL